MRKIISVLLLAGMVFELAGCATVQKKFTRKKKETRIPSVLYFEEGPYQKKYSNEYYYKTHYTMWRTWQDDLLLQLGGNHKKVARCSQEALSHLTEMNRYLVPEEQARLRPLLEELSRIEKKLTGNTYSDSQEGQIRTDLERIRRLTSNGFYYEKVKDKLLPDTIDLSSPK